MSIDRADYTKPVSVIGTVTITGDVTISGTVTISGSVTVTNTVTVTGTVAVSGTVTVAGTVAISGTVTVTGSVTVSGTVSISGTVTVTGTVAVSGTVTVTGAVTVSGTVSISGTVTVSGTVAISGTVTVSGAVTVSGTVAISGTVTITGAVTVTGDVNITNATLNVLLTNDAVTIGQAKPALAFDGTNDYVTFGDILDFTGTSAFTVIARVYLTPYSTLERQIISKRHTSAPTEGWNVKCTANANNVNLERYQAGAADGVAAAFTPSDWNTVEAKYDGTTMYICVGSGSWVSLASSKSIQATSEPLTLFMRSDTARWLEGKLSHLFVYDRALTDAECTTMLTHLDSPITKGLVLYCKVNEGAGTVLTDSSGSATNGTISGAVWVSEQGAVAPTVNINITAQSIANLKISIEAQTVDITILAPSGKRVMSGIGLPMKTDSYTYENFGPGAELTMWTLTGRGRIGSIAFVVIGKNSSYDMGDCGINVYNNGEGTASYNYTFLQLNYLNGWQMGAKLAAESTDIRVYPTVVNPRGGITFVRRYTDATKYEGGAFVCPDIEFETSSIVKLSRPSTGAADQWKVYAVIMYGYYP